MKKIWRIIDFAANNIYGILSIVIIVLSVAWKLSFSMLIYLLILSYYYIRISFTLQPYAKRIEEISLKEHDYIDITLAEQFKKEEQIKAERFIWKHRKITTILMVIFTLIFLSVLQLSANIEDFKQ
jgi:hypothetical protein